MSDDDKSTTSGNASSDQAGGETDPSGGSSGNGAADRDQGTGGGGENPSKASPSPDNSTSDDDGSALIKALSSGDLDSIGDDGSVKKPAGETPTKEPAADKKPAAEEPAADDKTDEKPKEPAKAEDDEAQVPLLTAEEQKEVEQAPKGYRKRLKDLLMERADQRLEVQKTKAQVEELAPVKQFTDAMIKHASEAGLVVTRDDGSIDTGNLRVLIEQERQLKGKSPKEIAAYYRGIAEDLDPDSTPVSIPQDLKDLVDTGTLPADEAEAIARKRMLKAKQPELDQRRQREEAARQEQQKRESGMQAFQQAQKTGYGEIKKVAQEYITRFGAEWDPIGKTVNEKLEKLIAKTDPSAWGDLARTVIEAEVAKRKAPLRKPSTTPAPNSPTARKAGEVMSEEDERKALSAGTL